MSNDRIIKIGDGKGPISPRETFDKLSTLVQEITSQVGQAPNDRMGIAYTALGAIVGAVQTMALVMGSYKGAPHEKEHTDAEIAKRVNDGSTLFCLLVAWAATSYSHKGENCTAVGCAMNPEAFYNAAEAFEKITGHKANDSIAPVICKAIAKYASEAEAGASVADSMLTQLMGARPANNQPA